MTSQTTCIFCDKPTKTGRQYFYSDIPRLDREGAAHPECLLVYLDKHYPDCPSSRGIRRAYPELAEVANP